MNNNDLEIFIIKNDAQNDTQNDAHLHKFVAYIAKSKIIPKMNSSLLLICMC